MRRRGGGRRGHLMERPGSAACHAEDIVGRGIRSERHCMTAAMRPIGANGDRGGHPAEAAFHPDGETTNASEPLKTNIGAAIRRPQLRRLGSSIRPNTVMQGFVAAKELDRLLLGKPRHVRPIVCPHIGISERDSTAPIPPGVRIVRETNAYLDRHALDPIRVADVVMHIGVSARLANLRYSESTGRSIQEELVNRRLSEAKRLLSKTSWPMKRIATRCGFSSATILAHLFTAHFGMSMRNFRASARGALK